MIEHSAMPVAIDPDLLNTLVAIVDTGGFAPAAERVHRTRSAVSMQMRRLEEIVGSPLFEREGRSARLNTNGETLLTYARRLLRLQSEALAAVTKRELVGSVRLGAPDDYADTILPPLLCRFARDYPHIEVEMRCEPSERLKQLIASEDVDVALVTRRPGWDDVVPLRLEPIVWAKSPSLRLSRRNQLPIAVFQPGCTARDLVLQALADTGCMYRIAYSSPSLAGLLPAVRSGLAVTALARCSVPADLEIVGDEAGLPDLPPLQLGLARQVPATAPANILAALIMAGLGGEAEL